MNLKAVIDTNVWVRCFGYGIVRDPKYPYTRILAAADARAFIPIYCPEMRWELEYVLAFSTDFAKRFKVDSLIAQEFVRAKIIEPGIEVPITGTLHVSTDEDDDMFIETAIVGGARVLVSDDKNLFEPAVLAELSRYKIHVLRPDAFWLHLRKISKP